MASRPGVISRSNVATEEGREKARAFARKSNEFAAKEVSDTEGMIAERFRQARSTAAGFDGNQHVAPEESFTCELVRLVQKLEEGSVWIFDAGGGDTGIHMFLGFVV